jgi:hypothetical protein
MSRYFTCPYCGGDVPIKALACPNCGSDEETGWSEEAKYMHLLPEREEEPVAASRRGDWRGPAVVAVALLVVLATFERLLITAPGGSYVRSLLLLLLVVVVLYIAAHNGVFQGKDSEARLYRELLIQTRGDREVAERLIDFERRRAPELNRAQLCRNALDRLKYDRR